MRLLRLLHEVAYDFAHMLTWRGRWEGLTYLVRRVFLRPAPIGERCYMGSPASNSIVVWCPRRRAEPDDLCHYHLRRTP